MRTNQPYKQIELFRVVEYPARLSGSRIAQQPRHFGNGTEVILVVTKDDMESDEEWTVTTSSLALQGDRVGEEMLVRIVLSIHCLRYGIS